MSYSADWAELYRRAILESDPGKLPARIEQASQAIRRRAWELWYAGSPETRERHDLDSALYFLGLLRTVSTDAGKRQAEPPVLSR